MSGGVRGGTPVSVATTPTPCNTLLILPYTQATALSSPECLTLDYTRNAPTK